MRDAGYRALLSLHVRARIVDWFPARWSWATLAMVSRVSYQRGHKVPGLHWDEWDWFNMG